MTLLILVYLGFVLATLLVKMLGYIEISNKLAAVGIVLGCMLFVFTFHYVY